jgi:hypothetical protein
MRESAVVTEKSAGEILLGTGVVGEDQLATARAAQARNGGSLLLNLVLAAGVDELSLVRGLARALGLPALRLGRKRVDPEVLALVSRELSTKYSCLPLFTKTEGVAQTLFLALEDPTDREAIDDVALHAGIEVRPVAVGPVELQRAMSEAYSRSQAPLDPPTPGSRPPASDDTAPVMEPIPAAEPPPRIDVTPVIDPQAAFGASPVAELVPQTDPAPAELVPQSEPAPVAEPMLRTDVTPVIEATPFFDPASRVEGTGSIDPASGPEAAGAARERERPRDVPTRDILRALTRLLIEKGVISRSELFESVDLGIRSADDEPGGRS